MLKNKHTVKISTGKIKEISCEIIRPKGIETTRRSLNIQKNIEFNKN